MNKEIKRGQVWFYKPSVERPGSIQKGARPVIIVSNDIMNLHSPVVLAVPCTTQLKRNFPTHVLFFMNGGVSAALTEQAGPVCVDELIDFKTLLPDYVMEQIDNALSISYGLKPMPTSDTQKASCPRPVESSEISKARKERVKWTADTMKKFLSDCMSINNIHQVASKWGLSVTSALTYKSRFAKRAGQYKQR